MYVAIIIIYMMHNNREHTVSNFCFFPAERSGHTGSPLSLLCHQAVDTHNRIHNLPPMLQCGCTHLLLELLIAASQPLVFSLQLLHTLPDGFQLLVLPLVGSSQIFQLTLVLITIILGLL